MGSRFEHLFNVPLFQIHSVAEIEIIREALEQNAETKQMRQEWINNLPPPLTEGEAIILKVYDEYVLLMGDGGTS
jgi:hypothetical protein